MSRELKRPVSADNMTVLVWEVLNDHSVFDKFLNDDEQLDLEDDLVELFELWNVANTD